VSANRLRLGFSANDVRAPRLRARRRSAHSSPLSPIEIGLVVAVVGIAAGIAVPDFLHMRHQSQSDPAATRLQDATKGLRQHHAAAGTYVGSPLPANVELVSAGRGSFCLETSSRGTTWHLAGPSGEPLRGSC
jgi:Tfp pilus assembly protein PilE